MLDTLLVGATGKLGQGLKSRLGSRCIATVRQPSPGSNEVTLDLSRLERFDRSCLDGLRYAVVLAAISDPNKCFLFPTLSYQTNVIGTQNLLELFFKFGIKPIFISTEMVFSGEKALYTETEKPKPLLLYGSQKLQIEGYIKRKFDDYLILRLAKIYSCSTSDDSLFNQFLRDRLEARQALYAVDQHFSPTAQIDFENIVQLCLNVNLSGLFHLSSSLRMNRWEVYSYFVERTGLYSHASPGRLEDIAFLEERPKDLSLNGSKLSKTLDYAYMSIQQGLEIWFNSWMQSESKF